jgi:hypothetical protein
VSEATNNLYFAVGVDVDPEVEVAFNEWYDTDHLPAVVACPGFVSGRRYELRGRDLPRFWAVYGVETKDAVRTPELEAISGFGRFEGAISNHRIVWLTSLTPLLLHGAEGVGEADDGA